MFIFDDEKNISAIHKKYYRMLNISTPLISLRRGTIQFLAYIKEPHFTDKMSK